MEPLKLSPDQSMTEFDIDSMSIFEILGELKQYYPDLPFTLLLEKQTLNEVGDYLCSNFPVETKKFLENEII
jgi:acyl carrier protein